VPALVAAGRAVVPLDLVDGVDVRDPAAVDAAVGKVDGVVHLAAISRVVWGERDPAACVDTNVGGTRNVLASALASSRRPFVVFASSREVYGEPGRLPVDEDAPLRPVNVYARTKVDGERLLASAREEGLRTAVVRLSNVYGDPLDHADRVVPAFARAAAEDAVLQVAGPDHVFDFTHLDDVVDGLLRVVARVASGQELPAVHLVSGRGTTLGGLAALAIAAAGGGRAVPAPERDYDVRRFVGDPTRAQRLLGWSATTGVEDGVRRLVAAFRRP
jgi:nucleoside-diphosphate-sugar epimerase